MIIDSTTLSDEQVGVCCRAMCEKFFVNQSLVGIWSLNHHLSGMNYSFVLEQAWKRIGRTQKDFISIPADRAGC